MISLSAALSSPVFASSRPVTAWGWTEAQLNERRDRLERIRAEQVAETLAAPRPQEAPQWTVLVYMAADNNLEKFALQDANELEFVGSAESMNLLMQIDRAEGYGDGDGDWTEARRYVVRQDDEDLAGLEINSELVQNLGEINTGDPANLVDFVTWGIQNYPAQHYALIIWDHGGAWYGAASDDSADGDLLTLPEVDTALTEIRQQVGIDKFDLIGFDACLMGAFEVYQTLQPHAQYAVASSELVPGNGWNYTDTLLDLLDFPDMDARQFGTSVVDRFVEYYTDVQTNYRTFTLSLIDLSKMAALDQAMQTFVEAVAASPAESLETLSAARSKALVYGGNGNPQQADIWSVVNLPQLMTSVIDLNAAPSLSQAAQSVLDASGEAILYHRSSAELEGLPDLSVYFPASGRIFSPDYLEKTVQTSSLWRGFLSNFYETAQALAAPIAILQGAVADRGNLTLQGQSGSGSTRTALIVTAPGPDGRPIVVDFQNLVDGAPRADWDAQITVMRQGDLQIPVLPLDAPGNQQAINGTLRPQNGDPIQAQLLLDAETGEVLSRWGVQQVGDSYIISAIEQQPGDQFNPTWTEVDEDGNLVTRESSEPIILGAPGEPFIIEAIPAPPGDYDVTLLVEDASGEVATDEAEVELEEDLTFDLPIDLPEFEDIDLLPPIDFPGIGEPGDEDTSAAERGAGSPAEEELIPLPPDDEGNTPEAPGSEGDNPEQPGGEEPPPEQPGGEEPPPEEPGG
ncbi:MAG: clostripain-related cysteine peptidase [bacterium]|nr:clostripain-related cysteine peptidase [bacterium]